MKHILLSALTMLVLFSCSKKDNLPAPYADFATAAVGDNMHAPATITFTNSSLNAGDYTWTFGDGSSSAERSPSHKYTAAGTYTVTLAATVGGKANTRTQTIVIKPAHTKVAITKITLTAVAETSAFTGFFRYADAEGNELWRSGSVTVNPSALPAQWTLATPYAFTNLSATYFVEVYKVGALGTVTRAGYSPLRPSLYSTGDIAANSYAPLIAGINGFNFAVQWQ